MIDVLSICTNANATAGFLEDSAAIKSELTGNAAALEAGPQQWAVRLSRWAQSDLGAAGMIRGLVAAIHALREEDNPDRPKVVCLCGSTRFRRQFAEAFYREEHAGRVCLTVPCYKDDPCCKTAEDHARLDALHRAKIDLADEILVIAPGGYIGNSTRREIAYATAAGKPVRYLEEPCPAA